MPRKQLRPPIKLRRKYAALIAKCRELILSSPPQTSGTGTGDAIISVVCKWPTRQGATKFVPDLPEDFPTGVFVDRSDEHVNIRHNCVSLLAWFKAKHYIDYDAKDLFRQRLSVFMMLAKMELKLDRMIDVNLPQDSKDKLDSIDE